VAEVTAAIGALTSENEAFRERIEAQLAEKYEQRREHLLLASMQTLETLDRGIDAARSTDAAEALLSGVMLVRTQLFRILQEEGLERVSVLGLPFDPRSAQAVQRRAVTDSDHDGLVVEELQGGHQLRGHVIRRAKVVVGEYAAAPAPAAAQAAAPEPATPEPAAPEPRAAEAPAAAVAIEDDDDVEPTVVMHAPDFSAPPPVEPAAAAPPPAVPEPAPPKRRMSTPLAPAPAPAPIQEAAATPAEPPPLPVARVPVPPPPSTTPPPQAPPPPSPPEAPVAEEPIVVENWTEPPPVETPVPPPAPPPIPEPRRLTPAAARPAAARPAAPLPPPEDEDDGSANATMVLGGDAALFVRPSPTPVPKPPPPRPASPVPPAQKDPKETQSVAPVPRPAPAVPAPPVVRVPPVAPPARVRTGPVAPPPRVRTPVYEDVPAPPGEAAPAPPVPATPAEAPPPSSRAGLYAGIAAGVVVLAVATAVLVSHFKGRGRGAVAPPPSTLARVAETAPAAASPAIEIPEEITVVTAPSAVASPPSPTSVSAASPAPAAAPSVAPSPRAARSTPPRTAAPPTTMPAPVNPVPALLAQAEQAMAAKHYDEAIARFGDVLKAEPQNAEAAAGRQRAMGERASAGRYFLTAVTVSEGKASGGGLKGFDGGQVVKSQCECALTYEVTPPNPVQGQPYSVAIFMKNDSRKDIKPQSLAVSVTVNGSAETRSVALATKEVSRGKKVLVGRLDETWRVGTTSWSMEAAVSAGGNTYRTQLTWELRVPSGQ
jgi:molecular chaperone GrpE (heat shock protein)